VPRNLLVEWLAFLLCTREVSGSDLGSKIEYPDWGFSCFSPVRSNKCRGSTSKLGHDRFLPNPFQLIIHLSSYYSTLSYSLKMPRLIYYKKIKKKPPCIEQQIEFRKSLPAQDNIRRNSECTSVYWTGFELHSDRSRTIRSSHSAVT
jgi:hypothetical protein